MTEVSRLLRGTLPVLVALAVATGFALPANSAPLARAPQMSGPDLASQWWLTSLGVPQAWRAASEGLSPWLRSVAVSPSIICRNRGFPSFICADRYVCRCCVPRVMNVLSSAIPMLPPMFRIKLIMLEI